MKTKTVSVENIYMYPIKSCGYFEVSHAEVCRSGLLDPWSGVRDREFALVSRRGAVLTERDEELEKMCLIKTELHRDNLRVLFPGEDAFTVPLECQRSERRQFSIHKTFTWGYDQGDEASEWFSDILQIPCRFVRFSDEVPRVKHTETESLFHLTYSDSRPILVLANESVQHFNEYLNIARVDVTMSPLRFRPNIVLRGGEPHKEDEWKKVEAPAYEGFKLIHSKPCGRCKMVNINPVTGEKNNEILRHLTQYGKSRAAFGSYYIPERLGVISAGDNLFVS